MHEDLTEQMDRVRRVRDVPPSEVYGCSDERIVEMLYVADLRDIADAAIDRINQEHEANK